jgi:hypothetical protein
METLCNTFVVLLQRDGHSNNIAPGSAGRLGFVRVPVLHSGQEGGGQARGKTAANAFQLILIIVFVALLMERLKQTFAASWFFVFTPLWISDAIAFAADVMEIRRLSRVQAESSLPPHGPLAAVCDKCARRI